MTKLEKREYDREYRRKNKEKIKKDKQQYEVKNKTKIQATRREYRASNATKIKEKASKYYLSKKEELSDKRRTKEGVVRAIYGAQRQSSKKRGHISPEYSVDDFIEWMMGNDIFHSLYSIWVDSGYDKYKKPSVDRKNDYIGYSFKNIQVVTWGENDTKAHIQHIKGESMPGEQCKSISQYTVDGTYVRSFVSISEAGRCCEVSFQNISKVCRGERQKAGGFLWRFSK